MRINASTGYSKLGVFLEAVDYTRFLCAPPYHVVAAMECCGMRRLHFNEWWMTAKAFEDNGLQWTWYIPSRMEECEAYLVQQSVRRYIEACNRENNRPPGVR